MRLFQSVLRTNCSVGKVVLWNYRWCARAGECMAIIRLSELRYIR